MKDERKKPRDDKKQKKARKRKTNYFLRFKVFLSKDIVVYAALILY